MTKNGVGPIRKRYKDTKDTWIQAGGGKDTENVAHRRNERSRVGTAEERDKELANAVRNQSKKRGHAEASQRRVLTKGNHTDKEDNQVLIEASRRHKNLRERCKQDINTPKGDKKDSPTDPEGQDRTQNLDTGIIERDYQKRDTAYMRYERTSQETTLRTTERDRDSEEFRMAPVRTCKYGRDDFGQALTKRQRERLDEFDRRLRKREQENISQAQERERKRQRTNLPRVTHPLIGRTRPQKTKLPPKATDNETAMERHRRAARRIRAVSRKERKKERYHDSLARSAAYQVLAPRNKSKNWNLPNEAQLRMLANDMRNRDPTMPDETKNDGTT